MPRRKTGIKVGAVPVYASQGKYDGLIQRHGQHVLWYSSQPCTCISDSGSADLGCSLCGGEGELHYLTTKITQDFIATGFGSTRVVFKGARFLGIYGAWIGNNKVSIDSFSGDTVYFKERIPKGRRVYVYADHSLVYQSSVSLKKLYDNIYQISDDKEFSKAIYQINSVTDGGGNSVDVESFWEDKLRLDTTGSTITLGADLIDPLVFAIQNVNPQEKMERNWHEQAYDAQVTVPGPFHVGFGDLITTLTPEAKDSLVGTYTGTDYFQLPYFHLGQVLRIIDEKETELDAHVVGPNTIQWGNQRPNNGSKFSVSFTYRPTFRVMDKLPQLRNSEDKNFPKRFMVNRYDNMAGRKILPKDTPDDTGTLTEGEIIL